LHRLTASKGCVQEEAEEQQMTDVPLTFDPLDPNLEDGSVHV